MSKDATTQNQNTVGVQQAQATETTAPQEHETQDPARHPALVLQRVMSVPPPDIPPTDILTLQRTIGNQATIRLLQDRGQYQAAQSRMNPAIQPALRVNAPGDAFEREADRVADTVMRMHKTPAVPSDQPDENSVQRQEATIQRSSDGSFDAPEGMHARIAARQGQGSPLSKNVRNFMEPRFKADFSRVRVHTDNEAAQMSRSVQARAFTHKNDIYFDKGTYNPSTPGGQRLLAHELTHTIQQGGAVQRQPEEPRPNDSYFCKRGAPESTQGGAVQRQPEEPRPNDSYFSRQGGAVQRQPIDTPPRISTQPDQGVQRKPSDVQPLLQYIEEQGLKPGTKLGKKMSYWGELVSALQHYSELESTAINERSMVLSSIAEIERNWTASYRKRLKARLGGPKSLDYSKDQFILHNLIPWKVAEQAEVRQAKKSLATRSKRRAIRLKHGPIPMVPSKPLPPVPSPKNMKETSLTTAGLWTKDFFKQKTPQEYGRADLQEIFDELTQYHRQVRKYQKLLSGQTAFDRKFKIIPVGKPEYDEVVERILDAIGHLQVLLLNWEKVWGEKPELETRKPTIAKFGQLVEQERFVWVLRLSSAKREANVEWIDVGDTGGQKASKSFEEFQQEVLESSAEKKKEYQVKLEETAATGLPKLAKVVNTLIPNQGDMVTVKVDLVAPGAPWLFAKLKLKMQFANWFGKVEIKNWGTLQVMFGQEQVAAGGAEAGFFAEAKANTATEAATALSYSMYRRFVESKYVAPWWATAKLWGGEASMSGWDKAAMWSAQAEEVFKSGGGEGKTAWFAGLAGQFKLGDIGGLEIELLQGGGHFYDKASIEALKGLGVVPEYGGKAQKSAGASYKLAKASFKTKLGPWFGSVAYKYEQIGAVDPETLTRSTDFDMPIVVGGKTVWKGAKKGYKKVRKKFGKPGSDDTGMTVDPKEPVVVETEPEPEPKPEYKPKHEVKIDARMNIPWADMTDSARAAKILLSAVQGMSSLARSYKEKQKEKQKDKTTSDDEQKMAGRIGHALTMVAAMAGSAASYSVPKSTFTYKAKGPEHIPSQWEAKGETRVTLHFEWKSDKWFILSFMLGNNIEVKGGGFFKGSFAKDSMLLAFYSHYDKTTRKYKEVEVDLAGFTGTVSNIWEAVAAKARRRKEKEETASIERPPLPDKPPPRLTDVRPLPPTPKTTKKLPSKPLPKLPPSKRPLPPTPQTN